MALKHLITLSLLLFSPFLFAQKNTTVDFDTILDLLSETTYYQYKLLDERENNFIDTIFQPYSNRTITTSTAGERFNYSAEKLNQFLYAVREHLSSLDRDVRNICFPMGDDSDKNDSQFNNFYNRHSYNLIDLNRIHLKISDIVYQYKTLCINTNFSPSCWDSSIVKFKAIYKKANELKVDSAINVMTTLDKCTAG